MTLVKNGRQVATSLDGIRDDHVKRYLLAAVHIGASARKSDSSRVIDAGCGVGYGSTILANAGLDVTAYESDESTVAYAKNYWDHDRVSFRNTRLESARFPKAVGVAAFEIIEHVEDDVGLLQKFIAAAPLLVGSVPNENVVPFDKTHTTPSGKYHFRHYKPLQILNLLRETGYKNITMYTQTGIQGGEAKIHKNMTNGRTLVFSANTFDE